MVKSPDWYYIYDLCKHLGMDDDEAYYEAERLSK